METIKTQLVEVSPGIVSFRNLEVWQLGNAKLDLHIAPVSDLLALRKKDIRDILKRDRASYTHPVATLTYTDGFKNLSIWSEGHGRSVVKPFVPHVGYSLEPENYFAHVKRRGGDKALRGGDPIPFVQIAKNSKNISLFTRMGQSRYPIRGVAAPAIPQVIKEDDVEQKVRKVAFDATQKELMRQVKLQIEHGAI